MFLKSIGVLLIMIGCSVLSVVLLLVLCLNQMFGQVVNRCQAMFIVAFSEIVIIHANEIRILIIEIRQIVFFSPCSFNLSNSLESMKNVVGKWNLSPSPSWYLRPWSNRMQISMLRIVYSTQQACQVVDSQNRDERGLLFFGRCINWQTIRPTIDSRLVYVRVLLTHSNTNQCLMIGNVQCALNSWPNVVIRVRNSSMNPNATNQCIILM